MKKINSPVREILRGTAILLLVVCISCDKDSKIYRTKTDSGYVHESQDREQGDVEIGPDETGDNEGAAWRRPRSDERIDERQRMAGKIENSYGLRNSKVLEAMRNVPRHWFVPEDERKRAYIDSPLPIGYDQTISQPFIVAYMTSLLELNADMKVLEIGTGSGYQAAVLNEFTPSVYSIEIVEELGRRSANLFEEHGYGSITTKIGDGYKGWPEHAPFDAIIVTCAPERIPEALLDQLKPNGRMIIPVGETWRVQELVLVTKDEKGKVTKKSSMPVRFVPMVPGKNN